MMRALLMMACFVMAGLNAWLIVEHNGGALNYIAVFACLGSALYGMASLVKYP